MGLSVPGRIYRRALVGRKSIGSKGVTKSEKELLSKIKKDKYDRTFPISRALTSPGVAAAVTGAPVGAITKVITGSNKATALATAIAAGIGYGGNVFGRHTYSRAMLGRAAKKRSGWTAGDKELLRQVKKKS